MQPTMKLRWKRVDGTAKSDPEIKNYYDESMVLQQWWEGSRLKEEYRKLPLGSLIPWDGKSIVDMYESHGEWRDIEIAEE